MADGPLDRRLPSLAQGCQMVCFQTKNPNWSTFWRVLQWRLVAYFMDTWSILWSFVTFYGHLVWLVVYIFPFWYFVPRKIWQPCIGCQRMFKVAPGPETIKPEESALRSCLDWNKSVWISETALRACFTLPCHQGDQRRLWKSCPQCSPTHFLLKLKTESLKTARIK
jgi:hypothetical protein